MFWYTLFWGVFCESSAWSLPTGEVIAFNDYNLQTANIITSKITVDSFPSVDYEAFNIPRWDWKGFLSKFYRERNIEIVWFLKAENELNLQLLIDEFKKNLSKTNWIFKYIVKAEYRQITATCTNLEISKEHYNLTMVPFVITLTTLESYFYNPSNLSATDSSNVSPRTIQINNLWSAVSLPQIYLTFSLVTSTNIVSMLLNWRTITYTWTINNGDILLFDSLNKQVLKNWVLVEYSWTFSKLEVDINSLIFTINGTRTVDYIISYRNNYI